jgi:hypothetical protein
LPESGAATTEIRTQVARPELPPLHLVLERLRDPPLDGIAKIEGIRWTRKEITERLDVLAGEVLDPVELLLKLGIGLEVPGHGHLQMRRAARSPALRRILPHPRPVPALENGDRDPTASSCLRSR